MKTITDLDAKSDSSRVLEDVADGETFVITVAGAPVAHVSPLGKRTPAPSVEAVQALRDFRRRENPSLGGLSIRDLIEEGRRYRCRS